MLKKEVKDLCRNYIGLDIGGKAAAVVGGTRFGGVPDVPADFVWPYYEGEDYDEVVKSRPMSFIAQFNCAELAPMDAEGLLPKTGLLSFFYEMETMRCGFDPKDAGCARVFWFEDSSTLVPAQVPEDLETDHRFPMLQIAMEPGTSYIDMEDFRLYLDDDAYWFYTGEIDEIYEELDIAENTSKLLGWPHVTQGSIMSDCVFASSGYYTGDPEGLAKIPQAEREEKMKTALEDWRLLLQLDIADLEEENFTFCDCGRIYFCIRQEDLLARRFDRVWLILQYY
ncbi:MAG: DUF1963 domain-containing protein [Oscillospiraceae bacterium]|nr:DUF1963 domain-containing protein [Oscillospiraceae bacterium]